MKNIKTLFGVILGKVCLLLLFISLALFSCENEDKEDSARESLTPEDLVIDEIEDDQTIELTWKIPEDPGVLSNRDVAKITGYEVQISRIKDFSEILKTVRVDVPKLVIDNSTERFEDVSAGGREYYFRVRSLNNSSHPKSDYSVPLYFVFGEVSKAEAPSLPESLEIDEATISGNRVSIIWQAPSSTGRLKDGVSEAQIIGYRIAYSTQTNFSEGSTTVVFIDSNRTSYQIDGLSLTTRYYVRVSARNNNGDRYEQDSGYTQPVGFSTNNLTQSGPSVPRLFRVLTSTVTSTSFTLAWEPPVMPGKAEGGDKDATITSYEIQYSTSPTFKVANRLVSVVVANNPNQALEMNIIGLLPFTKYYARVRAVNDNTIQAASRSAYSTPIDGGITTSRPPGSGVAERPLPVNNIKASLIKEDSAVISWDASLDFGKGFDGQPANLNGYTLQYSEDSDFVTYDTIDVLPTSPTAIDLQNLDVGSDGYYVRIITKNDNGINGLNTSVYSYLETPFVPTKPRPPVAPTLEVSLDDADPKTAVVARWTIVDPGASGDHITPAIIQQVTIEYSKTSTFANPILLTSNSPGLGYMNIDHLKPDTSYYFRAKLVNNNLDNGSGVYNTSEYSVTAEVTTTTDASAPTAPLNVTLTVPSGNEGRTKVDVEWEEPNDLGKRPDGSSSSVVGYRIDYLEQENPTDRFVEAPVNYVSKTLRGTDVTGFIDGLKPRSNYLVRVIALNTNSESQSSEVSDLGFSPPSPSMAIQTSGLFDPPLTHGSPIVKNIGQNPSYDRVVLVIPAFTGDNKWGVDDDGTPVLTGTRTLQIQKVGDSSYQDLPSYQISAEAEQEVTVDHLDPNTLYKFRIVVRAGQRFEKEGSEVDVKTKLLPIPPAVHPAPTVYDLPPTSTSVKLTIPAFENPPIWGKDYNGDDYNSGNRVLLMSEVVGGTPGTYQVIPVSIPSDETRSHIVTVTNLNPNSQYLFRVDVDNGQPSFNTSEGTPSAGILTVALAPDAPSSVDAVGKNKRIDVSWTPPANTGGYPISGYSISWSDPFGTVLGSADVGSGQSSYAISTDLSDGTLYIVSVRAVTNSGKYTGPARTANAFTYDVPNRPVISSAPATPAKGGIQINWGPPSNPDNNRPVDRYYVRKTTGQLTYDPSSSTLVRTVPEDGSPTYTYNEAGVYGPVAYAIVPSNVIGLGSYATRSFLNIEKPSEPRTPTVISSGESKTFEIQWQAPAYNGGGTIQSYRIYYDKTSGFDISDKPYVTKQVSSSDTSRIISHTFDVPEYGSYYFKVVAINDGPITVSMSQPSVEMFASTATKPEIPRGLTVAPEVEGSPRPVSYDSITLEWQRPSTDGGETITEYIVAYIEDSLGRDPDRTTDPTKSVNVIDPSQTAYSTTIGGLSTKTEYRFVVYAVNDVGVGEASSVYSYSTEDIRPTSFVINFETRYTSYVSFNSIAFFDTNGQQLPSSEIKIDSWSPANGDNPDLSYNGRFKKDDILEKVQLGAINNTKATVTAKYTGRVARVAKMTYKYSSGHPRALSLYSVTVNYTDGTSKVTTGGTIISGRGTYRLDLSVP